VEDLEGRGKDGAYLVVAVDESEYVSLFSNTKVYLQQKIRDAKDFPKDMGDKDLFGMGYPYLVCLYQSHIAISTDYGVALLETTLKLN